MGAYSQQDMIAAAYGAALLGSGGGGDINVWTNLIYGIPSSAAVNVVDYASIGTARATTVGLIGTPKSAVSPSDIEQAAAATVNFMSSFAAGDGQGALTAVIPLSINPMNVALAFREAARYGLVVCDGDGAGRGTSSLATTTYTDLPINPVIISSVTAADEHTVAIEVAAAPAADSIMRSIIASAPFSGYCAVSAWLMQGEQQFQTPIWGTLSDALQIGRQILATTTSQGIVDFINNTLGRQATKLMSGTLSIEHQYEVSGLTRRRLRITAPDSGYARIYTEKESMLYWDAYLTNAAQPPDSFGPRNTAPASICLWDEVANKPLTDFDVPDFVGQPVSVIRISASDQLVQHAACMSAFFSSLHTMNYAGPLLIA